MEPFKEGYFSYSTSSASDTKMECRVFMAMNTTLSTLSSIAQRIRNKIPAFNTVGRMAEFT